MAEITLSRRHSNHLSRYCFGASVHQRPPPFVREYFGSLPSSARTSISKRAARGREKFEDFSGRFLRRKRSPVPPKTRASLGKLGCTGSSRCVRRREKERALLPGKPRGDYRFWEPKERGNPVRRLGAISGADRRRKKQTRKRRRLARRFFPPGEPSSRHQRSG